MPFITLDAAAGRAPRSVHYRMRGPDDAATTLVCVHELGGCLQSLDAFVDAMPADIRIVTFDQRGAGQSEHATNPFTMGDLAFDLDRLATALGLREPFHLLGMAMGAVVSLRYATRFGARVTSLVLCDATGEITPEARRYILERATAVRADGIRPVAERSFVNAFKGLPDPLADPAWTEFRHRYLNNAPLSYALLSEALANEAFTDEELNAVRCPVLLITGEHDFIWPPSTGRALAARLPGSLFEEVPQAAHFPLLQRPDYTAARVDAFLRQSAKAV